MIDNFMGPMPEDRYREIQRTGAIGGSGLVKIQRLSVAHYLADLERMSSRSAVTLGNVVHTAVLEPHMFAERFYVAPEVIKADVPEPWKVERPEVSKADDGLWRIEGELVAYDTKAAAAEASKAFSGWTIDGQTFYRTRKALAEQCGGLLPWTLAGDGPQPTFRTREEAKAHARTFGGERQTISADTLTQSDEIVHALRAHPLASRLLDGARCEEVVLWHDHAHGLDCSGKIDAQKEVGGELAAQLGIEPGLVGIDLKTTGKGAAPSRMARMCHNSGWHIQAAHYMAGCAANGVELTAWINIVVETEAPYGVAIVVLSPLFLALGEHERAEAMRRVLDWRLTGVAAGYAVEPVLVEPPAWAVPLEVEAADLIAWRDDAGAAGRAARLAEARTLADRATMKMAGAMGAIQEVALEAARAARAGDYGEAVRLSEDIERLQQNAAEYAADAARHTDEAAALSRGVQ